MISTIVHAAALLCLLAYKAEAWSLSSPTPLRHHRLTFSSSPLTKDTCNNKSNIHRLTAAAAFRHTNNSVTPFNQQHYRSDKHVILSAASSASTDCNNNNTKTHAVHKSNNTRRIGIIYQLLQQLIIRSTMLKSSLNASLTKASLKKVNLKAAVSNTMLSFGIMLSILGIVNVSFPTMALARSTSVTTKSRGASTATRGAARSGNGVGTGSEAGRKVAKFVVTLGAVGAGAASANLMRGKFNYCSKEEDCDGGKKEGGQQQQQQVGGIDGGDGGGGGTVNNMKSATNNANGGLNDSKATTKKMEESLVEPLSEKWIQQQLNDVEKRSIVLNDAIKMQQQQQQMQQQQVGNNKSTQKKVSIGNTIGINNNKNPLVKNLDSKIELLQRQQNERSIEQQRRITEESNEMNKKALIAKEMAEKKIEAAELEYKQQQQQAAQQQQQVAVPREQMTQQQQQTRLNKVLVGYGGSPAKSKEEDLELTTQIILEHVNTIDNNEGGGVVDDDE